jgi:bifunctional non-homologous end joining protein LigD
LIEGRDVRVMHPDKLVYLKQTQVSKLDIVRYYLFVAPATLTGIRDRPLCSKALLRPAEEAPDPDDDATRERRATNASKRPAK